MDLKITNEILVAAADLYARGYKMKRKFVIFNSWYIQHINTEVNK